MFKGVHELPPGHLLTVQNGRRARRALLGGRVRARLRPHRALLRRPAPRDRRRLGDDAPARGRAGRRVPQRRPRLEHRRVARRARGRARASRRSTASSPTAPTTTRARTRASSPAGATSSCTRSRSARRTSSTTIRRSCYHLDFPVAGPGAFPQYIVSRLAREHMKVVLGGQGGDEIVRRLRALPARVLRAVHQGRDRRDDAQRQLRRHVRVDHPEPRDAARVQAADAGVLARGPLRRSRPALLPPHRPRARRSASVIDWSILGDYSPFETFRSIFRAGNVRQGVVLRPDDALRLQDAAAGAAARRGPREHGARARVARAASSTTRSSSSPPRCRPT